MKKVIGISLLCLATLMVALPGCTTEEPGYIVIAVSEAVAASERDITGVTDHGELTGLGDDDHPQYHTDARGDARYYTQVALNAGQLDSRYYTEGETDAEIATHAALSTGTHGVGTGTITSVSTANKNIYVDKEATGAADGTSWADAFTTIQAAVDSMEDVIIHAYTIYVRDGTKKTGTADQNLLNHLVDDGNSQFVAGDVGKRVFNVDDGTWGVVGSYVDAGDLGIINKAGANLDLFPTGTEDYVIEATPYRETVNLNQAPASYPSHLILGSVIIEAEHYWYGDCDAQANAGEILDATADFTNVEVGDRVFVIDRNGASSRTQDYEYGTVDDVSQVGSDIVRTTLTKTPTTNWKYAIVKTEISGSDDGTIGGKARGACFLVWPNANNVSIKGFYLTLSSSVVVDYNGALSGQVYSTIFQDCTYGMRAKWGSSIRVLYCGFKDCPYSLWCETSYLESFYCFIATSGVGVYAIREAYSDDRYIYFDGCSYAFFGGDMSFMLAGYSTIKNNVTRGIYVRRNTCAQKAGLTNNAITPEDPAGTVEGAYIQ